MAKSNGSDVTVATNRRARHDYDILDTWECGVVLTGSEVKSLRAAEVVIKDAYAEISENEVWLENMHIAPYLFAREGGHEAERRRKLLMHRREIDRLSGRIKEQGLTLVPLKVYFKNNRVKIELALVKGRRNYDKRQAIRTREEKREMDRAVRRQRDG